MTGAPKLEGSQWQAIRNMVNLGMGLRTGMAIVSIEADSPILLKRRISLDSVPCSGMRIESVN